jgi:large subunit ribosomal protein L9
MDIILMKDMEALGRAGAVVRVKPGYARNYLLPRGLAVAATPQHLRAVEDTRRQRAAQDQRAKTEAEAVKRKLEGQALTLKLSVGEDEKPFGSVTVHDIVEALKQQGLDVEKHAIRLEEPIKTLGVFGVPVRVHPDVTATLKLTVGKA